MIEKKRTDTPKVGIKKSKKKTVGKFAQEVAKKWHENLAQRLEVVEKPGHKPQADSPLNLRMNIRAVNRLSKWAQMADASHVGRGVTGLLILENHRSLEIKEQVLDAMADIIGYWEMNYKKSPIAAITAVQILQKTLSITICDEAKALEDNLTAHHGIRAH